MPPSPYSGIIHKVGKTQVKTIDWVGKGVVKTALSVDVLDGPFQGTQAILLVETNPGKSWVAYGWNLEETIRAYELAKDTGYVPQVLDYSLDPPKLLITPAKGADICKTSSVTPKQHLLVVEAYIALAKRGIFQYDPNCGNVFVDGDTLTIIDDLSLDTDKSSTMDKLYTAFRLLTVLQRYAGPGREYAEQFYVEYGTKSDKQYKFNPDKKFVPLVAKNPASQPFYDEVNKIVENALREGGKRRKTRKASLKKRKRPSRRRSFHRRV